MMKAKKKRLIMKRAILTFGTVLILSFGLILLIWNTGINGLLVFDVLILFTAFSLLFALHYFTNDYYEWLERKIKSETPVEGHRLKYTNNASNGNNP